MHSQQGFGKRHTTVDIKGEMVAIGKERGCKRVAFLGEQIQPVHHGADIVHQRLAATLNRIFGKGGINENTVRACDIPILGCNGGTEDRRHGHAALGVYFTGYRDMNAVTPPSIPTCTRPSARISQYGITWDSMGIYGCQRDYAT